MHKIKDIYEVLNEISPFELQEKWDNSGLVVGSLEQEFKDIYISIDLDLEMLENIPNNSLIITHHPLIFSALKQINFDSYATKLLQVLIKKDISLISMHTNIDKTHLNKYVAEKVLGFTIKDNEDFICYSDVNLPFNELQNKVKNALNLQNFKSVQCHDHIKTVAITTGSGMSLIGNVKADCYLTGDIKYHDAMEAKLRNISLIDIGHFESEHHFSTLLKEILPKNLKNKPLQAIITSSKNPFTSSQGN